MLEMGGNGWGNRYWIDIIYNSFDKERVLSEYELEEVHRKEQIEMDRKLDDLFNN